MEAIQFLSSLISLGTKVQEPLGRKVIKQKANLKMSLNLGSWLQSILLSYLAKNLASESPKVYIWYKQQSLPYPILQDLHQLFFNKPLSE